MTITGSLLMVLALHQFHKRIFDCSFGGLCFCVVVSFRPQIPRYFLWINFRADIGPTNFNLPHNFNQSLLWELPFAKLTGARSRAMKLLVDGWQISEIFTATSGLPFNVTDGNSTYPSSRPYLVSGAGAINDNYRGTLRYLNPAAFAVPATGTQGNVSAAPPLPELPAVTVDGRPRATR